MKTFIILAGPNGSGKSSFLSSLKRDSSILEKRGISFEDLLYINADYYARTNPALSETGAGIEKDRTAWRGTEKWRDDSLESGENIIWETVFSHESRIGVIEKAHRLGYYVLVFYVTTLSPSINIERIRNRVREGGHDVPADKIISRYERSTDMIPDILFSADEVFIYDNSSEKPIVTFCKVNKKYTEISNNAVYCPDFFIRSECVIGHDEYSWIYEHAVRPLEKLGHVIMRIKHDN